MAMKFRSYSVAIENNQASYRLTWGWDPNFLLINMVHPPEVTLVTYN